MDQWFIKIGDKVRGPGTRQNLLSAFQKGTINASTQVAESENGPWKPLGDTGIVPKTPDNPFIPGSAGNVKPSGGGAGALDGFFKDQPVYGQSRECASFIERFAASLIDGVIFTVATTALTIIVTPVTVIMVKIAPGIAGALSAILSLAGMLLWPLYIVVFQQKWGWTIGRKVMKMHVETAEGQKPSVQVFIVRFAASILSSLILGIGYLMALGDPQTRTLHDKMAGTLVVKDK
ncbi:MAG: hypothetical protein RIQ81_2246 [Pseudomonadota bacterium]